MAICGIDGEKIPMMDTKRKLKSGEAICSNHWKTAGFTLTDRPKDYTLNDVEARLNALVKELDGGNELSKSDSKALGYLASKHLSKLSPDALDAAKHISADLAGNGLIKAGMTLSMTNAADQVKVSYLSALVEQNWIIMQQNQEIIDLMKKDK
ncbi:hypothetical protein [Levilactobacillus cerevisiae]|uniref:hypothetical protein n=1 Tax=Levilactobacillus cerevisiae TaxID=1704076 RepID=UPI000F766492|nr:hypothetical protein [Levilactobacillus cerevisiae]